MINDVLTEKLTFREHISSPRESLLFVTRTPFLNKNKKIFPLRQFLRKDEIEGQPHSIFFTPSKGFY